MDRTATGAAEAQAEGKGSGMIYEVGYIPTPGLRLVEIEAGSKAEAMELAAARPGHASLGIMLGARPKGTTSGSAWPDMATDRLRELQSGVISG